MATAPAILAWAGSAHAGRIQIRTLAGEELLCPDLATLAAHLRQREDPWGGLVRCAAALGTALHAMQRAKAGADLFSALDEAKALLHDLPLGPMLARLRTCVEKHRDILGGPECAARLVLEARRLQREQAEAVATAAAEAAVAIPTSGPLLLAWPGGPGCDLGGGLLTGAVATARRSGEVQIAGPAALAGEAITCLAGQGLAAGLAAPGRAPAAVLLRCLGDGSLAEAGAVALAGEAVGRGAGVVAIGVRGDLPPQRDGLATLAGMPRLRCFLATPPPIGS